MCPCVGDDHRWPSAENWPCCSDGWSPEVPGSHSSFQLLPGTHVNLSCFLSLTPSISGVLPSLLPSMHCDRYDRTDSSCKPKSVWSLTSTGEQQGAKLAVFGARWCHSLKSTINSDIIRHQRSANSRRSFCYLLWDIQLPAFTQI